MDRIYLIRKCEYVITVKKGKSTKFDKANNGSVDVARGYSGRISTRDMMLRFTNGVELSARGDDAHDVSQIVHGKFSAEDFGTGQGIQLEPMAGSRVMRYASAPSSETVSFL